jgi:PTS system nitrogen regulatory IIA component
MSVHHCFDTGTVVTDITSQYKFQAIRELIRRAPVFQELSDRDALEKAVVERERLQTTGLGHGVAVAHGRTPAANRVLIALGLCRDGIPFDSPDGKPVRLLFVIASPPSMSLDYLQALSTLVRCVRHQGLRDSLFAAESVHAVEARIRDAFAGMLEEAAC